MKSSKSILLVVNSFIFLCVIQLQSQTLAERFAISNELMSALEESGNKYLNDDSEAKFKNIKINHTIFEATYRNAKSVMANLKGGISYQEYGNVIRPFVSEVAILEDEINTEDEKYLYEMYLSVTKIYTAAGRVWSDAIANGNSNSDQILSETWTIAGMILEKANDVYLTNKKNKTVKTPKRK